ncbi:MULTISPECIES: hypothetical protein [Paenibacillus]|uniref:Uncharacterized protein n=1 Tax=Paenibacillus residui TaxID=629724 RepID=A0ABW3D788_9BACL|nr:MULTISPECIES: hypothetical protein [Paenibacillaceae]
MHPRVKVSIRCKACGERFVLKGNREKGRIETGFKRCLCDNERDFDIDILDYD